MSSGFWRTEQPRNECRARLGAPCSSKSKITVEIIERRAEFGQRNDLAVASGLAVRATINDRFAGYIRQNRRDCV